MRTNFSIRHVRSAVSLARRSAEIERAYLDKPKEFPADSRTEYEANVVGSIFVLVAFLEATINELFADAAERANNLMEHLNHSSINAIGALWKHESKYRTLERYQLALELSEKTPLEAGQPTYQNASLVVRMRNALIHYHPEWVAAGSDIEDMNALGRSLSGKFPPDPFIGQGNPYFPNRCLNYGCAKWAINSCLQFTDEFFSRIGVTPGYHSIRSSLALS